MPSSLEDLRAALAGRYEIEREIGQGGMATVYLADDLRHDRKVEYDRDLGFLGSTALTYHANTKATGAC